MDILIASLRKNVAEFLEMLLSNEPDMTIVGQAENTADLLEKAHSSSPDLVLVEWDLLGPSKDDTIGVLGGLEHPPDMVVYGQQSDSNQVALNAGADAYVWVGDGPQVMLTAIRNVHQRRGG